MLSVRKLLPREFGKSLVVSRILVVFLVATGTSFGYRTGALPPIPDVELPVLYGFARWDASFYLGIAKDGYSAFPDQRAYAFRPLFPLIIRLTYPLFGWLDVRSAEVLAGFAWNLVAVVLIAVYLERVTKILMGSAVANRALFLLAIFPSTFFLSAIYTEATNLLLIVISLYLLETKKILRAGFTGFLAGLVRPETFLLSVPFFVKWLQEKGRIRLLAGSIVVFLSLPAFAVFAFYQTGNVFAELQVQQAWPKCTLFCFLANPVFQLSRDSLPYMINFATMALAVAFALRPLISGASPRLFPYFLWTFILIAIVFYVGEVRAWARLVLLMPPVFWSQAEYSLNHPRFFQVLTVSYAVMMCLATVLFVNWYPML